MGEQYREENDGPSFEVALENKGKNQIYPVGPIPLSIARDIDNLLKDRERKIKRGYAFHKVRTYGRRICCECGKRMTQYNPGRRCLYHFWELMLLYYEIPIKDIVNVFGFRKYKKRKQSKTLSNESAKWAKN